MVKDAKNEVKFQLAYPVTKIWLPESAAICAGVMPQHPPIKLRTVNPLNQNISTR